MKFKFILFILFLSCSNIQKNKIIKNTEFVYDTNFNQDKSKYFVSKRVASNREKLAFYTYSIDNTLLEGMEYYKWGWFSIKFKDSIKYINELYYEDTTLEIDEIVSNREYAINLKGDTICNQSFYYCLSNLNQNSDSTKDIELQLSIPCSGFLDNDEIVFKGQLTLTNNKDVFKLIEINTKNKNTNLNIGKFKKGEYKIYGKIYVYHMIKNTPKSDMYRILYLVEDLTIL